MKKHENLSSAKAVVSLLALSIVAALFYKFWVNQDFFMQDVNALRNFVVLSIIAGAFLVVLLYLTSQTTHKSPSKSAKKKNK